MFFVFNKPFCNEKGILILLNKDTFLVISLSSLIAFQLIDVKLLLVG